MATTIVTKYGGDAPAASDIVRGELAVDTENGRLYTENSSGAVVEIGLNPEGNVDVTGTVTTDGLTSAGDVAITGGSSGSTVLTLTTNALADTPLMLFQRTGGAIAGKLAYEDGNTAMSFGTTTAHELKFLTSNTERMQITSAGSVGIGTSSPSELLHVSGASSPAIRVTATNTPVSVSMQADDATGFLSTVTNHPLVFRTNNAERMRVTASGDVEVKGGNELKVYRGDNASYGSMKYLTGSGGLQFNDQNSDGISFVRGGSNETMRIDGATGNVGVGVTPSAAYKMQVAVATNTVSTGSPAAGSIFNVSGGTTTVGDGVSLQLTNVSGAKETGWRISAVTASGNNGDLVFNGYAGGADYPERMRIDSSGNLALMTDGAEFKLYYTEPRKFISNSGASVTIKQIDNDAASAFIDFAAWDNSSLMRLMNSGSLLVGHTNGDNSRVSVEAVSTGVAMHFRRNTATYTTSAIVGSIVCDSSSTTYNTSSDQRLKDNIVDAPSASDDIDAIQVRSFDWKADGSHQKYGMVAQELQTVAPEAVSAPEDPEEMMGVDYSKLVPMMLKEIQSLRARVAQLES
jgi:hypothetical protein